MEDILRKSLQRELDQAVAPIQAIYVRVLELELENARLQAQLQAQESGDGQPQ